MNSCTVIIWKCRKKQNHSPYSFQCKMILVSQNPRLAGVGRDLCGSPSPTPLLKQGHLQQAAQDLVQAGLEYLQRRRLHNLPGQPVPLLHHPQSEEVLPCVQTVLPMLPFVPIARHNIQNVPYPKHVWGWEEGKGHAPDTLVMSGVPPRARFWVRSGFTSLSMIWMRGLSAPSVSL